MPQATSAERGGRYGNSPALTAARFPCRQDALSYSVATVSHNRTEGGKCEVPALSRLKLDVCAGERLHLRCSVVGAALIFVSPAQSQTVYFKEFKYALRMPDRTGLLEGWRWVALAPQGRLKIAQRFIAGSAKSMISPVGTAEVLDRHRYEGAWRVIWWMPRPVFRLVLVFGKGEKF